MVVMAKAGLLPSAGTGVLLEREDQVAALHSLVDAALVGGGRFVVVEGTAGIGKTRLLAEARAIADLAGMRVLGARGGELEGEGTRDRPTAVRAAARVRLSGLPQ